MDVKIMNLDVKIVNLEVKIVNLDVRWISGGSQVDRRWIAGGSQVDLRWISGGRWPELSSNVFSTFVGTSQAKPYFLRAFLEGRRPKMVSEVGVLYGAVMKKSKKHCTGAPQSHQVL